MIPHYRGNLPYIATDQMRSLELTMIENFGISRLQIMENAGIDIALLARHKFFSKDLMNKKIVVVAGTGINAGCVLAAARRLKIWGADVSILLSDPKGKFIQETISQFSVCQKMKIPFVDSPDNADLIIESVLEEGFTGNPNAHAAKIIGMINESAAPVLSLESPSGLDLNTGKHGTPTVKATTTLALAIPKTGLFKLAASKYTGELFLGDLSLPPEIFKSVKVDTEPFKKVFNEGPVVKINKVIVLS